MNRLSSPLALAERRVREDEERVARQADIVQRLDRAGHGWAAEEAGRVLLGSEADLELARNNLRVQLACAAGGQAQLPS